MNTQKNTSNWYANTVGLILVVYLCVNTSYVTYIIVNVTGDISDKVINILFAILGFLTAKLSTTIDWAFSGTSTTKRQGEIIATQANTADTLAKSASAAAMPAAGDKGEVHGK